MRFTRIVATIGPATSSPEKITKLIESGVNICRLNFSHGDYKVHGETMKHIRAYNKKNNASVGIMLDTKGPEIRTGDVATPLTIKKGDIVTFTSRDVTGKEKGPVIHVNYGKFAKDCKNARCIVLDNGTLEMKVMSIRKDIVIAKALDSGSIGSRRHINLPGAMISLPSYTDRDWQDILFGIKNDIDFIAVSFVRTGKDIQELRAFLEKYRSKAHIIAKIETQQAVENIDDIIFHSDGIMVARGDLGSEVPFEDVPRIQDSIVVKCRVAAKPVIVATHMLESMIENPTPTRAEVTDIAHAAQSQADATMLSGETASGLYPFKSVDAMATVLDVSEKLEPDFEILTGDKTDVEFVKKEQALSACVLATTLQADAIIVISRHGISARAVSNCRPLVPIFAFANDEACRRRMNLLWGVTPYCIPFSSAPEKTRYRAMKLLIAKNIVKKGQRIVVVSDIGIGASRVMSIQILEV